MSLDPVRVFKCLGDETRLMLTLLVLREQELCVCEMTHALELSQPKVSRHLAQLRQCGLLEDRREGQWVYYGIEASLPGWVMATLAGGGRGASHAARTGVRAPGADGQPARASNRALLSTTRPRACPR